MPEQPDDLPEPADVDGSTGLSHGAAPAETDSPAPVEVEVLAGHIAAAMPSGAVTLNGEAARDVRDALGGALVESAKTGARAMRRTTYKLVPSEATSKGLADGTLRWADASKGDASVLIKDTATGRVAGHGQLHKVRPSPAKVLGPAAWQAMALATQQHYLVEINEKLAGIERGVNEVMSLMTDEQAAVLDEAETYVRRTRRWLGEGRGPSDPGLLELRRNLAAVNSVWFGLRRTVDRRLAAYVKGGAAPSDVENAWDMLLRATHVLGECSALFITQPFPTVAELDRVTAEEQERVLDAVNVVRVLAGKLHAAHLTWARANAEWHFARTRNPVRKAVRTVRKTAIPEPKQRPLDNVTAWRASQLTAPPRPPAALLVAVNEDGTVDVVAEPAGDAGVPV